MKAMVLDDPAPIATKPLQLRTLDDPEPAAGEVRIAVRACGVCRSNLHMVRGDWASSGVPSFTPIIPGHEAVGVIEQVGPGVTQVHVGDRVGVQPLWSTCGRCRYCLSGCEELCQSKQITGETVNGGYAEAMIAPAAFVYRLPDVLDDAAAAPLFCPGITGYGAVAKARLTPASTVAVFGIGGVGHLALQFAKLTGARTIAVSRSATNVELAEELGADLALSSDDADTERILRDADIDAAIVFAPSDVVAQQALAVTRPGGTVVMGVNANIGEFAFATGKTVVGSLLGTRPMMRDVLRLAAAHAVHVVAKAMPLAQANEALGLLEAGQVRGRLVLTP